MGYSLKRTNILNCGCKKEIYENDDFPTTDERITRCDNCKSTEFRKQEEKTKYYLNGKIKFAEFSQLVPTIDVNMVKKTNMVVNYVLIIIYLELKKY